MTSVATRRIAQGAETGQLFHALSDETRLAVLDMLRGGERCVCDLQAALDAAQSRLSFHLKVLKDAGLVTDRKEGRWSYYSIVPERLDEARAILDHLTTPVQPTSGLALHQLGRGLVLASAPARASSVTANGRKVNRESGARRGDCCSDDCC